MKNIGAGLGKLTVYAYSQSQRDRKAREAEEERRRVTEMKRDPPDWLLKLEHEMKQEEKEREQWRQDHRVARTLFGRMGEYYLRGGR